MTTQYAQLDQPTPDQGGLTEFHYSENPLENLREILPALAELSQQDKWILLIAPPQVPHETVLADWGIDTHKILVIRAEQISDKSECILKALSCGNCSAVVAWTEELFEEELHSIKSSSEQGCCEVFLFNQVQPINLEAKPVVSAEKVVCQFKTPKLTNALMPTLHTDKDNSQQRVLFI